MALPRWSLRLIWSLHSSLVRVTGGRIGLSTASEQRLGTLKLRTIGRRSGEERGSMLFYLTDGADLVVVASNAGATSDPGWWRNLQAHPDARVDLPGQSLDVRAREAQGEERVRLWARFEPLAAYASYARVADRVIPVVILQPVDGNAGA